VALTILIVERSGGGELSLQTVAYLNGPESILVEGNDGNLYGVAHSSGASLPGGAFGDTIYKTSPQGGTTVVYRVTSSGEGFPSWRPAISLSRGTDGGIYGTISRYGPNLYGTVFRLESNTVVNTLFAFNFGNRIPTGALVQHSDGTFYGGSLNFLFVPLDVGKIFKLATNGTYTECFAFSGTNGSYPRALLFGQDGNLYGTSLGGQGFTGDPFSGHGTVFQLTPGGVFTSLVSFNGTNGSRPSASFVQGPDGNFYGTTEIGGALDCGTLFRMTPDGDLTTLHSFDGPTAPGRMV
jgi:uncharacterized repeat protein (TIGR03803 family)